MLSLSFIASRHYLHIANPVLMGEMDHKSHNLRSAILDLVWLLVHAILYKDSSLFKVGIEVSYPGAFTSR